MKPPEGLDLRITGRDLTNNTVTVTATIREVVHACPPSGSGLTLCCERTPFDLPAWHRITLVAELVTCAGPPIGAIE